MTKHKDTIDASDGALVLPCHEVIVDSADFAGGAATENIDPGAFPATHMVVASDVECLQAVTFTGTDTTGLGLTVGSTTDPDGLLVSGAVTSMTVGQRSQLGGGGALAGLFTRGFVPRIVPTATGGAPDTADVTAGRWLVRYYYVTAAS